MNQNKIFTQDKIPLRAFKQNESIEISLDKTNPWMNDILTELEESANEENFEEESFLNTKLQIKRTSSPLFSDHLILQGSIQSGYKTQCIRCLENAHENLDINFEVCFLDENFEEDERFNDQDQVVIGENEFQLYFLAADRLLIKDFIHEQVFMNINFLPLHDENCQGLCGVCGTNLNTSKCKHMALN